MSDWYLFYEKRVNSSYQEYFEARYKAFLDLIMVSGPKRVREEGCGIGSVMKYLMKHNVKCVGFDTDLTMVNLTMRNLGYDVLVYQDCILKPQVELKNNFDIVVTHGVLEHFTDDEIHAIIKRYDGVKNIHYIPSDKYVKPSFGDERLLSKEYWKKLLSTHDVLDFNEGFDLVLVSK